MAENSTPEERTELPTEKRMTQLREEGTLAVSTDITQVASLMTGFILLYMLWGWFVEDFKAILRDCFTSIAHSEPLTLQTAFARVYDITLMLLPPMLILLIGVSIVSTLSVMLQTQWNVRKQLVKFKFDQLNPAGGIKRILSPQGVMNTGKALLKLCLILPIGYLVLADFAPDMIMLIHLSVTDVFWLTGNSIWSAFWKIMYVLIALAVIDFIWSKYQWLKQNKMTKDEIKDERKSLEGDEQTKRAIRAKGLGRIAQRIRDSVPLADVIITNPTHYAIALKYDRDRMDAPMVIAKGRGFMALRIREIAKEAGVPIMERKPLARALYASVDVGGQIPHELFKAVAEVLAYVYRIRPRRPSAASLQQRGVE